MKINPKNVTVTKAALETLIKSVPRGALSAMNERRLVPLLVYVYGMEYTDKNGNTIKDDNANYLMAQIDPHKLKDQVILELSEDQFIAVSFEFPYSEDRKYTIDFDGEHLVVY